MTNTSSQTKGTDARRGLATVAFLKAQFDARRDQLDSLQPFVEDSLRSLDQDEVQLTDVEHAVRKSTGIGIPSDTLKTLLRRAARKRLVQRKGGRFFRTAKCSALPDLQPILGQFDSEHKELAARLGQYASERNEDLGSQDDALAALVDFLDKHHLGVVLGQTIEAREVRRYSRVDKVIAAFIARIVAEGASASTVLDRIVKGFIVQNALLLRDIPNIGRELKHLSLYLDTGVLLYALGHAGKTEERSTRDALKLIRRAGARLYAFERTLDEMKGVLRVYEQRLGTSAGRKTLRPTPLTHHFLQTATSPADIQQEIALVEKKLAALNVNVKDFPGYKNDYTEAEQDLANQLKDPTIGRATDEHRIWHDVRATAAVMTLRAGRRPYRVTDAKYVFASGNARTVTTISKWYRETYKTGLEPAVHVRSVTNAAWLLRPQFESSIPIHQLVSVCAAVLRPSPEIWSRFIKRLGEFVESGELSDDESVAVVAHQFAHARLGELDPDDDVEASTAREIVERSQEQAKAGLRQEIQQERHRRETTEKAADAVRGQIAAMRELADARAEKWASIVAAIVYGVVSLLLVAMAIWTLPTEWSQATRASKIGNVIWWICAAVPVGLYVLGLYSRFQILDVYGRLRQILRQVFYRFLMPDDES